MQLKYRHPRLSSELSEFVIFIRSNILQIIEAWAIIILSCENELLKLRLAL